MTEKTYLDGVRDGADAGILLTMLQLVQGNDVANEDELFQRFAVYYAKPERPKLPPETVKKITAVVTGEAYAEDAGNA